MDRKKIDYSIMIGMAAALTALLVWARRADGSREPWGAGSGLRPEPPVLSAESGFYDDPFLLEITVPEGARAYYTLDGSPPDAGACLYRGPIEIASGGGRESDETFVQNMQLDWMGREGESHPNRATVLRACAVYKDGEVSEAVTATYFVGEEHLRDKLVVSLVADPEDLFGENGIYVTGKDYDEWYLGDRAGEMPVPNFLRRGEAWERPAVAELFWEDGSLQQEAGLRIQGASARNYANKRFSVYARKKYGGSSWFETPLFGGSRVHSFALRSGFMNGYIQQLVQDRDVAAARSREAIVYLNGALWYITMAQEKYSGKYFQENYGVDDDNIVMVKAGAPENGEAGDMALYQAVYDFLNTHDMAEAASYQGLDRLMDIQSYIDFCCVNVYFANLDFSETKNTFCWRARKTGQSLYEDGRWRWALYDLDLENLDYGVFVEEINTFTTDTHYAGAAFNTRPMYAALKRSPKFCRQFVVSFMDMVNTDFTVERASEVMEEWGATPEWWGMSPDWTETFFPARTEAVIGHLAEEFGLTGSCENLRLSVNRTGAGGILLNTVRPDLSEGEWSGRYFSDYPVTVTAVAEEGYRFVGWRSDAWEGMEQETALTLDIPEGGFWLEAVFEKYK